MSRIATPSSWNAVEIAILGENRSSAHATTASGSSPSNSTESSPASSSSISSTLICRSSSRSRRLLVPLAPARRLQAGERAQLLVGEATRERREALPLPAAVEPALDQGGDRHVQLLRRHAPEERPGNARVGAEPAAEEDVVGLPTPPVVGARGRALEAEVGDPVLRAGGGAAAEPGPQAAGPLAGAGLGAL